MSIYHAIKHLFPAITDEQFRLQDDSDGKGVYIAHWDDTLGPKPTAEQIEATYPAVQAEQLQHAVSNAVQKRLDEFARTRGYDGILSAASYATSNNPRFAAEGQRAVDARDAHWATCYEIMAAVQGGQRPMPTLEQVIAELPALAWPNRTGIDEGLNPP